LGVENGAEVLSMTRKKDDAAGDAARVSRRGFLFGAGVTAAATAAEGCLSPDTPEGAAAAVIGPGAVPITLRINGKEQRVEATPSHTLAEVLRVELGMTGTKVVCDRGACGACTVWLDGTPVCACMTFVLDAAGHDITTVEGLAKGEQLHPVQAAFVEHDAAQCGFCTPGMVMSCAALLQRKSSPTLDDVKAAVSGNLCRCGTYPNVFKATLAAAKKGA
jgi:aerobic-type carbon monoxide dehydrogenase small subunit (CoxS/CutS family)